MKEQPETKLVQRINKGQSGKNEAVHSKKNQLFEHVARMSKELAQPRMAFRIHLANEQVDIKFGLRDPHNLTLPWEEAAINDSTDGLFDAPPFPALTDSHLSGNAFALPPLVPVYGDDQEPMGFEYSTNERNSRDLAAVYRLLDGDSSVVSSVSADGGDGAGDADIDANADATAAAAPAAAERPPTARQGGLRATAARKSRATNAATAEPIKPTSVEEVDLLAKSLTEARRQVKAARGKAVEERAAALYLEGVTKAHLGEERPPGLRFARTSPAIIKTMLADTYKTSQLMQRELGDSEAVGDLSAALAEEGAAADAAIAAEAAPATADGAAKPAASAKEKTAARAKQARTAAREVVRGSPRADPPVPPQPLRLAELKKAKISALRLRVLVEYARATNTVKAARGQTADGIDALKLTNIEKAKAELVNWLQTKKWRAAMWSEDAGHLIELK